MATARRVKNKAITVFWVVMAFNLFFIMSLIEEGIGLAYASVATQSDEALEAKIIAKDLAKLKKIERKSAVTELLNEGKRNYDTKNYETAIDFFQRALQADPANKTAKRYMELCNKAMRKQMPATVTESLVKRGKENFNKQEYGEAISNFEAALAANSSDEEAKAGLIKAQEAKDLYEEKLYEEKLKAIEERKKIKATRNAAAKQKDAAEEAMMLQVDRGWLAPEKVTHKEMEVEEIISPEELAEQEAKKKLEEKMSNVVVPAISVTDADVRDLIRQLMEMTGVTIVLDERALAELTKEQPIRISITTSSPMPLLDILKIAFKTTELGYKVEPNYVWVSDKATVAKEELVTRTYRLKYGVRKARKIELKEFGTQTGGYR